MLDAGCGNGRFLGLLHAHLGEHAKQGFSVGLDRSLELLLQARRVELATAGMAAVLGDTERSCFRPNSFDLVALFGVLHHIPGFEARLVLIESLLKLVNEDGVLFLSLWQFGKDARFAKRRVPLNEALPDLSGAALLAFERDLEPGDQFLRWGDSKVVGRWRYCHDFTDEEVDTLVSRLDATLLTRFSEEGKNRNLNAYLVLRPYRRQPG